MDSAGSPQGRTSGRRQAIDEVPAEARTEQVGRLAAERYRFRLFWDTASGFWRGESRRLAWLLTISLLVLVLLDIAVQYGINVWNRHIFDALEQRDGREVVIQALVFPLLAAISVALGVALVYGRMTTQREWRAWTTRRIVDRWLANGRYYQLNLVRGDHQVPEYRISEDVRIATDPPVDFAVGIVSSIVSAVTFIGVLWFVGGALTVTIAETTVTIPGFLVVAAAIYALLASLAMLRIGRRFVPVSMQTNQAEAEYRYALTRVRESGESIALLGGEQEERVGLEKALQFVLRSWRRVLGQHMRTTVVSHGSGLIAPVVPLVLAAPKFLAGTMTLGQVMQVVFAFIAVQSAFSWLVNNFPPLADWTASVRRVASLLASLEALERAERGEGVGRIARRRALDAALQLHDLSVTLDDGTAVVNDADLEIAPGEKVLVVGESGSGKSTLVRAIAGLWPWGEGEVVIQLGARLLLLPQRPYLPLGSLRRATTYPLAPDSVSEERVKGALVDVGLGYLSERLDDEESWEQVLSGGEKQRLAFARLLIHQPDIVVIDEGTAALDPASQARLMRLLARRLPRTTVISVSHRPELEAFHDRELIFERWPGGARLVSDRRLPGSPKSKLRKSWEWARGMGRRGVRKKDGAPVGTAT